MDVTNVMDRWVLASMQSLISFIRQEMAGTEILQWYKELLVLAYRLYTVVPRLLNVVDQLTNWYVRFNRKRLRGEMGIEEATLAVNTLFEVLITMCRIMVSIPTILNTCHRRPSLPSWQSTCTRISNSSCHTIHKSRMIAVCTFWCSLKSRQSTWAVTLSEPCPGCRVSLNWADLSGIERICHWRYTS